MVVIQGAILCSYTIFVGLWRAKPPRSYYTCVYVPPKFHAPYVPCVQSAHVPLSRALVVIVVLRFSVAFWRIFITCMVHFIGSRKGGG